MSGNGNLTARVAGVMFKNKCPAFVYCLIHELAFVFHDFERKKIICHDTREVAVGGGGDQIAGIADFVIDDY